MSAGKDADAVELRAGRRPPQKTEVFDWVTLSGVSPHAIALYVILRMHVNRARDDEEVWTSTLTLAVLMGLSRGDKIKPYLDELVEIGAVEVARGGLHRKNRYTVHSLPPADYRGVLDVKTWYAVHKPLLDLKRKEEKDKRDERRRKQRTTKPQANPVTPKTGEQAVTPETGEQVPPKTGEPVPPFSGREPRRGFQPAVDEPPTPPPSSSSPPPWAVSPDPEQEKPDPKKDQPPVVLTAEEETLAAEVLAERRDWSPTVLREVLASPQIRERSDRNLVRAAFLRGAREPKTITPRRLLHDLCPHWAQAARDLGGGPVPPVVPSPRRNGLAWCGQPDCDPTTRQLVDGEMRPRFTEVDGRRVPVWCPRCSRHATAPALQA